MMIVSQSQHKNLILSVEMEMKTQEKSVEKLD
jgi:hypothetical protein